MARTIELSPNQIVAFNLEKFRRERGWTALQTAARLGAILGRKISLASYSAMERSVEGGRVKAFDADELFALARLFGVRVWQLMIPPINFLLHPVRVRIKGAPADQSIGRVAALTLILETPEGIFSEFAARAAGEKPRPKHAEPPLNPNDPFDVAILQYFLRPKPSPASLGEQAKQTEELISLFREVNEARKSVNDAGGEKRSPHRTKSGRRKKR